MRCNGPKACCCRPGIRSSAISTGKSNNATGCSGACRMTGVWVRWRCGWSSSVALWLALLRLTCLMPDGTAVMFPGNHPRRLLNRLR